MSDQDLYTNYDFIDETGKRIFKIISSDNNNDKWINSVIEDYNNNLEYPSDLSKKLKILLENDKQTLNDFCKIVQYNVNDPEQIYNSIFFPSNDNETVIYEEEDSVDIFTTDTNEEEDVYVALTPESLAIRQQKLIEQASQTFYISSDLSYLLLKKFNWNMDLLTSQWIEFPEMQGEIIKSFHIPENMIHDDLRLKPVGKGECDVCMNEDVDLYQLYCGHVLCGDCWAGEMNFQISEGKSTVVCRIDQCNAEIMLPDVAKFCGQEKADRFHHFMLEDQISRDNKLIHCTAPNCDQVLTLNSVGLCGVATCTCGKRICWKCLKDAHAPLTCEQVDQWNAVRDEMNRLINMQKHWELREFKLVSYRAEHLKEVNAVTSAYNKQLKQEYSMLDEQEIKEIQKLKDEMKKITDPNIKEKWQQRINEKEHVHKMKSQERSKELTDIVDEQKMYKEAFKNVRYAKFYMHQLIESNKLRAIENNCTTDEEFIEKMTKKCPHCGVRFQKNGGCNFMKCPNCNFEFCWICGADWKTHDDHFVCNKYDRNNTKDNATVEDVTVSEDIEIDDTDLSYHLPPMNSADMAKYERFNHYYHRYQGHIDAQMMESKIRNHCKEVLVSQWTEMSSKSASELVDIVFRAIDVARSVLIYSYPTAYFLEQYTTNFTMFETCQSNLELSNEKLVGMVERNEGQRPEEFEKFAKMNKKYVDILLREVDSFSA